MAHDDEHLCTKHEVGIFAIFDSSIKLYNLNLTVCGWMTTWQRNVVSICSRGMEVLIGKNIIKRPEEHRPLRTKKHVGS